MDRNHLTTTIVCSFLIGLIYPLLANDEKADRPNILWIVSEDNGPFLGCYGDKLAKTPNIDALAAKGYRYTNCFANTPVCAPARSSWILGVAAVTTGTHNMRSKYKVPESLTPYPTLLKKAGYYVTNASKTDYNTSSFGKSIWDECGKNATYSKRRNKTLPFFAIFNLTDSHESNIFPDKFKSRHKDRVLPEAKSIPIPPYQIDNPETRRDWQRLYGSIETMDLRAGKVIEELEKSGEAENTIIFYCSDHGGVTIRSKRYLEDSGTRVPFICYFPEKWKHLAPKGYAPGTSTKRLTQFLDMPKTYLSLAQAKVPAYMPGRILAGPAEQEPRSQVFLFSGRFDETADTSRGLTDGRYKYIRHYEPDRPAHQLLQYPLKQDAQQAHYVAFTSGKTNPTQSQIFKAQPPEAFFDTQTDPHEIANLIHSADHQALIKQFRKALDNHILESHDLGFIPEPLFEVLDQKHSSVKKWAEDWKNYPIKRVLKIANLAQQQNSANIEHLTTALANENSIIRYWGAHGLRVLKKQATPAKAELEKALQDADASVRITAAIALGSIGQKDKIIPFLIEEAVQAKHDIHASWALSGLKYLEHTQLPKDHKKEDFIKGEYSGRSYEDLSKGKTLTHLPQ